MDAQEILARTRPQVVEVEALGGTIHVKKLSAREAMTLQVEDQSDATPEWMAKAVALAVVAADGSPLFTEADVERLPDLPFSDLQEMLAAVLDANGIGREAVEEAPGN